MNKIRIIRVFVFVIVNVIVNALASCSTTAGLSDGEVLYTGLKSIDHNNHDKSLHYRETKDEVEASLATAPNGALFGSSYYRTPFPYGLWVWNKWHDSNSPVAKWIVKSFGKAPVLMQNVKPNVRAVITRNVLENNGYFHGKVDYQIIPQKNPKKAKVQYTVDYGQLFTLDTIFYSNFPHETWEKLIRTKSLLHTGDPFSVETLDNERTRISNTLQNSGYYFYQKEYMSYLADTIQKPG